MARPIDLNRMYVFRAVVQTGSITKAAKILNQPKSNISRQLSALEAEIGVPLIVRTTRQLSLTSAGQELSNTVLPLLNEIEISLGKIVEGTETVSGKIRVSVPEDVGIELMGGIARSFQSLYPEVVLDIHIGNRWVDLVKESFDIAVRVGRMNDSTLIQHKIADVTLGLYISPALKTKMSSFKIPSDVSDIPYLAFSSNPKLTGATLNLTYESEVKSVKLNTTFASSSFFCLRDMAIREAGMAVLPPFVAEKSVQIGELVRVLREWEIDHLPIHALIPHQKDVPLRTRKFIEHLRQSLGSVIS